MERGGNEDAPRVKDATELKNGVFFSLFQLYTGGEADVLNISLSGLQHNASRHKSMPEGTVMGVARTLVQGVPFRVPLQSCVDFLRIVGALDDVPRVLRASRYHHNVHKQIIVINNDAKISERKVRKTGRPV